MLAGDELERVLDEMRHGFVVPARYSARSWRSRLGGLLMLFAFTAAAVVGSMLLCEATRRPG